ncbi:hypothetical protein FACS1894184_21120 [Clostridia bacterium]|nr:hypothetical protein FACS1894184_21120 [Clostridia bacterium]
MTNSPLVITPIQLVHALVDRVRDILSNIRMEESDGEHVMRAPNVWAQSLPEKQFDDQPDPADYPFAVVMLGGGGGIVDGKMTCNVGIWVCGYDDGLPIDGTPDGVHDRQGWMLPAMLTWRIITSLAVDPSIGAYALDLGNLSWDLPTENQPAPQWHGVINTQWSISMRTGKDYDIDNVLSYGYLPCPKPLSEDIRTFMEGE